MNRIAQDQTADPKATAQKATIGQTVPKEKSERFQEALSDAVVKGSEKLKATARPQQSAPEHRSLFAERTAGPPSSFPTSHREWSERAPNERELSLGNGRRSLAETPAPFSSAGRSGSGFAAGTREPGAAPIWAWDRAEPSSRHAGLRNARFDTAGEPAARTRYGNTDRWDVRPPVADRSQRAHWSVSDGARRDTLSFQTAPRTIAHVANDGQSPVRSPRLDFVSAIAAAEFGDTPPTSDADADPRARHINPIRAALQQAGVATLYDEPGAAAEPIAVAPDDLLQRADFDVDLAQMADAANRALAAEGGAVTDPAQSSDWTVTLREGPAGARTAAVMPEPEDAGRRTRRGARGADVRIVQNARANAAGAAQVHAPADGELSGPTVTVNIVRQEVHLPPVRTNVFGTEALDKPTLQKAPAPTAEPVLAQLRAALLADPAADPTGQQTEHTTGRQAQPAMAQAQVVKVVELMLRPASLGLLTVTMRLTGTGLRVSVNASERETTALLQEQEDALKSVLSDAGYDIEGLDITFKSRPDTAASRPATLYGGRA